MSLVIQIDRRNIELSSAVVHAIREKAAWLARINPQIRSCSVLPGVKYDRHGMPEHYFVDLELQLPDGRLCVRYHRSYPYEPFQCVLTKAFDEARHELGLAMQSRSLGWEGPLSGFPAS